MTFLLRPRGFMASCIIASAFYLASIFTVLSIATPSLFVVEALQVSVNNRVAIQLSPLIGGPAWLTVHCKVIVDESHVFDFIPLNAASTETLKKLITLQKVPATVRIIQKNDKSEVNSSFNNRSGDGDDDELAKLYVEQAVQFSEEYDQDLHLISNNCWSFAFDLLRNIISNPESARGAF